ncbi:MAG: UDP-N-acetylmuramate dehydrogenase [Armatimonadetes bacterium]|nr:UDP-N-acetylmuramate dehydrogenase [Armatimonadota bacterium]MDE2207423.1 UDP-N-acetylmuramate dehydrogenase [Armatimonadota bacterium]
MTQMDAQTVAEEWGPAVRNLPLRLRSVLRAGEPMCRHTSLRVGGPADWFAEVDDSNILAELVQTAQSARLPYFLLGEGTNICVSDRGVRGLVIHNRCHSLDLGRRCTVETGHNLMRLFLLAMRAELSGLEYAVGIPGSVGGALASNAGAYQAQICDLVEEVEVVDEGLRQWRPAAWMEFRYRDSRLRRSAAERPVVLSARMRLLPSTHKAIREKARKLQTQRILSQPWESSAGSFFKNSVNHALAQTVPNIRPEARAADKVPTAALSEACGMKGFRFGGAAISARHANFIVNCGGATAGDVRTVADTLKRRVLEQFGLALEEEVMYVGDWSGWPESDG